MTTAAKKQALAIRQLNNAASNLFDAGEAQLLTDKATGLKLARQVVLALSNSVEYGAAYLPRLNSFVEDYTTHENKRRIAIVRG